MACGFCRESWISDLLLCLYALLLCTKGESVKTLIMSNFHVQICSALDSLEQFVEEQNLDPLYSDK